MPATKIIKRTPEEVEAMMVPKLVEILYPVLIPFEQQDVHIQAANRRKIESAARAAWQSFVSR